MKGSYYALNLIDENYNFIGRSEGDPKEPFLIYCNDVEALRLFLERVGFPHRCSKIDGKFYDGIVVDLSLLKDEDGSETITVAQKSGLPESFLKEVFNED